MKVLKALIRHKVLRGNASDLKDLFLNPAQIHVLERIGSRDVTSSLLAQEMGVSIHNANAKLERLRKGGYLTRANVGDPTGGNMYQYGVTRVVNNLLNS